MSGLSALRKVAQQAAGSVRRVSSSTAARAGYGNEPVRLLRRTADATRASSGVQSLLAALHALGPYALVKRHYPSLPQIRLFSPLPPLTPCRPRLAALPTRAYYVRD